VFLGFLLAGEALFETSWDLTFVLAVPDSLLLPFDFPPRFALGGFHRFFPQRS